MIEFDDIFDLPFFLARDKDSTIRKYIEAHNDETDDFGNKLEEALESHQIDNASGDELDEIGAAFGILGRRRERNDQEYRIYLKSLVQSFRGRGTIPGIISAVAAGLNVDEDQIEIEEDYQNLEYIITLYEWTDHRGSTVEELSELADASVSNLKRTVYKIDEEEMEVDDSINVTVSTRVEDEDISIADLAEVNPDLTNIADAMEVDDLAEVNPDLTTTTEEVTADDTAQVNPDKTTTTDEAAVDDNTEVYETETARWDQERVGWDFFEWEALTELSRSLPLEEMSVTDATAIDANKNTASDESGAADDVFVDQNKVAAAAESAGVSDSVDIRFNVTSVTDTAYSDDTVSIDGNTVSSTDVAGAADGVSTSVTNVAWESGTWNTMTWTKEHN